MNLNNGSGGSEAEDRMVSLRSWGMELGPEGLGGCGVG